MLYNRNGDSMKVLITGATSGIGKSFAKVFHDNGYDLVLVARSLEKLEEMKKMYGRKTKIIDMDLSSTYNCMELYEMCKKDKIDVVINNAGFGDCGYFIETNLNKELNMIDLNIKSVQILTKMFLNDFMKHNRGYILNVASSAAFMPGPLMATYYATKAYVLHLTESINEELRRKKSNVFICALCPGPVSTNFNKVAGVSFNLESLESYDVAKYAVKQMFKKKVVIIPGFKIKMGVFALRLLPRSLVRKIAYKIQKNKEN